MGSVSMNIDQSVVNSIVAAEVQAAVAKALTGHEQMVSAIVAQALTMKVDSEGKISKYDSYNTRTYLEYFVNQAIQEAAKEAFQEYMVEIKPKIKAELVKQIRKQTSAESLAGVILEGLGQSVASKWRVGVELRLAEMKND